jgi:hypothetical protein
VWSFHICLLLLSTFLRFIHNVVWIRAALIFNAEYYSLVWMHTRESTCYLLGFWVTSTFLILFWTFTNKSLYGHMFLLLLGVRIVGLLGEYMFNIFKNFQTVSQRGCIILYFCWQHIRATASPHSCQHLLRSLFLIIASVLNMQCCLVMVLFAFLWWWWTSFCVPIDHS